MAGGNCCDVTVCLQHETDIAGNDMGNRNKFAYQGSLFTVANRFVNKTLRLDVAKHLMAEFKRASYVVRTARQYYQINQLYLNCLNIELHKYLKKVPKTKVYSFTKPEKYDQQQTK